MSIRTFVRSLFAPATTPAPIRTRLGLQTLEARDVPATFTVTNALDSGTGSLRWAVQQATTRQGDDTVVFASNVGTIKLNSPIDLSNAAGVSGTVSVQGGGKTISGQGFTLAAGSQASISQVTLNGVLSTNKVSGATAVRNQGVLTLTDCTISSFRNPLGGVGGVDNSGRLVAIGCQFIDCAAGAVTSQVFSGVGAIRNRSGTLEVERSVFSGNSGIGYPGAICSINGTVTITGSTFTGNRVNYGSLGAITAWGGSLTVRGSRITDTAGGMGIHGIGSVAVIENSLVARNDGGVLQIGGGITVRNTTVISNANYGVSASQDSTVTLANTIAAGNGSATSPRDISVTLTAASKNNLIASAASAGGLRNGVNGNIVGINGTGTRPVATIVNTDGTLVAGSVAINGGDNALAPTYSAFDLAGKKRVVGTRIDIGAFEVQ